MEEINYRSVNFQPGSSSTMKYIEHVKVTTFRLDSLAKTMDITPEIGEDGCDNFYFLHLIPFME